MVPNSDEGRDLETITILGANGFVGSKLCEMALAAGHSVRAVSRADWDAVPGVVKVVRAHPTSANDLFSGSNWVVNCIGRAHVLKEENASTAMQHFRAINCDLATELAWQAKAEGVTSFAQVSSVAAIRSSSAIQEIIDDRTPTAPDRAYGVSKLAADVALMHDDYLPMRVVCLRPPALFGPHPVGFVRKLAKAANRGVPLPLDCLKNLRSFTAVQNFADAVLISLRQGLRGAYVVTDYPPMTVSDFYGHMLRSAGYGNRTFRLPVGPIKTAAAGILGARKDSLLGNAAYNGSRFALETGWRPHVSLQCAMDEMMASL